MDELADALRFAMDNNAIATNLTVKEIWVAGGIYKPMYSPADKNFGTDQGSDNAFLLVKDVKLYGGFAGTETQLSQRNWQLNQTVLSGEIQEDAIMSNNAFHGTGFTLS